MIKRSLAALAFLLCAHASRADVVINEIHYDPDVKTELVEFIELHNTAATPVDLSGWTISDAVDFTFPFNTSIEANGYLVVCANPAHFNAKFGKSALGPWTGSLRNEGEEIVLRDLDGAVVDRVEYQLGFPWPTVGEAPGSSIELVNPAFDNDLGGNWRPTPVVDSQPKTFKYFKGRQEPSSPIDAWRDINFVEDANWLTGTMPIGYDPAIAMSTTLTDWNNSYTTFYIRRTFFVDDPQLITSLQLKASYDDGFKAWINGRLVANPNMTADEAPFNSVANSTRENPAAETFTLPPPGEYLVQGKNILAIQVANVLLSGSSDFFIDAELIGIDNRSAATPGEPNRSMTNNVAPAIRQVDHSPNQPMPSEAVTINAKVTDPEGVTSVQLLYQVVEPGNYIELTDANYQTSWTPVTMNDAGTGGDEFAGDSVYTAILPGSLQTNRRLIRYRISATDGLGKAITAPYADDPAPNFAYFCYAGVPAWSGAIQPGSADQTRATPQTYPESLMRSLPTYHLISKKTSVEDSTWRSRYPGDQYPWVGTLVYDGKVYDHVHYRARGGVWRYAMGKNMWKFDFNRGHDFKARDNWGREYKVGWTKLNLGACIQQGDYLHRGEQGMFESVGFRLFNLTGLEAPMTHFIHFRVIDEAAETGANQYTGDLWGLYLAVEQEDSRFLQAHDMPDSNLYKMEGGFGDLNNVGELGPTDGSDLAQFLSDIGITQPESWWRENFDLPRYYNYRTIVEAIHHYDIDGNPGKNYFYYNNDVTRKWEVHPWDLDLTWADNMYGTGNEQFKSRVLPIANLNREYKNRIREIRDLLWNTDEAYKLIDEYAAMIHTPGAPSFVGVDRAMWDYNPIMISAYVNSSKSGQGKFYQRAATRDFPGMVQIMKNYVVARGNLLDSLASDAGLPAKPTISNVSPAGNPANRLTFQSSAYSGSSAFAAMQWRIGEITPAGHPAYDRNNPRVYEIEPVWQSPEITMFANRITVPAGAVKVGHTYRARVKMKDTLGRWSNWSAPVEFIAGESDAITSLVNNLRISEVMFNPPPGSDYEFIELFNSSADLSLDLSGVRFTAGIDYTFPTNSTLAPRSYCLVTRAPSLTAFRNYYGLTAETKIYGPYSGSLNNAGEEITLKTATAGTTIVSFTYGDNASWPVAANGAGHSMIPLFDTVPQNNDDFSYPGNWRASAYIKGSPGQADPEPPTGLVINEVMANTQYSDPSAPGYDSNDWIEILNPTDAAVDWAGYYLSDDPLALKKWAIPAGTLDAGALASFDELTGFHSPITAGFGLDQAGEQVFLSHFPAGAAARVVDAVEFKGLSLTSSWSRLPGGWRGAVPTRNAPNGPAINGLIISEIMFHPATNVNTTIDNTLDEYVEIHNPTATAVGLYAIGATWRLEGGVDFQFPAGVTLAPGETLLLVNFSPTQTATSNAFRAKFNVPADTRIFGPYQGKLGNDSDRVAIERPEPPKAPGEPIVWIVVDEVTYGKRPLWPAEPNGTGPSLHRVSSTAAGNYPANWRSGAPDPGRVVTANADRDNDGMPDAWEVANNLDPDSPADAAADADGDGIFNLAEFQSGTDPRDANSGLKIASVHIELGQFKARVSVTAGKTYILEKCDDWNTPLWQTVRQIDASQTGIIDFTDPSGASNDNRFYRIRLGP